MGRNDSDETVCIQKCCVPPVEHPARPVVVVMVGEVVVVATGGSTDDCYLDPRSADVAHAAAVVLWFVFRVRGRCLVRVARCGHQLGQ